MGGLRGPAKNNQDKERDDNRYEVQSLQSIGLSICTAQLIRTAGISYLNFVEVDAWRHRDTKTSCFVGLKRIQIHQIKVADRGQKNRRRDDVTEQREFLRDNCLLLVTEEHQDPCRLNGSSLSRQPR